MTTTATTSRIVTPEQFAEHFGISRRAAYKLIDEGAVPVFKLGPRTRRIDLDAAEQALLEGGTRD